jgi:hypothetical protein
MTGRTFRDAFLVEPGYDVPFLKGLSSISMRRREKSDNISLGFLRRDYDEEALLKEKIGEPDGRVHIVFVASEI